MPFSFRATARLCLALLLTSCFLLPAKAQAPKIYSSSEILLGLKKLNVVGSVMYIAAHPDDENTRLLAYLANGRLLETSYLSCTRGDGGQNLIGPELREQLGVIRTQELLAARRIDGAHQYFTRANDFGFSKTSEETLRIWDHEQVLSDMVWVIRQRRPDILITRFPPDPRAGHGHHQASAILAAEAFDAAGDPKRFPEQLKYVQVWQPKRLYWNTGSFFVKPGENMDAYLKLDAGGYNALLGQSYGEIAARSRSQHRSQGFGSAAQRGEAIEYFQFVKGTPAKTDLFEGIDQTWNRVPGGAAIGKMVDEVIRKYDAANPSTSVAGLTSVLNAIVSLQSYSSANSVTVYPPLTGVSNSGVKVKKAAESMDAAYWADMKGQEALQLIQACSGVYIEATTSEPTAVAGSKVNVTMEITSRIPIAEGVADYATAEMKKLMAGAMPNSSKKQMELTLPAAVATSQPYWLRKPGTIGMYKVPTFLNDAEQAKLLIGKPENEAALVVPFDIQLHNNYFVVPIPVKYKHTDPVLGELYQPLAVVPPVMVNIPAARAYVFADQQPKPVPVTLRAGQAGVQGQLALQVPTGWQAEPATVAFDLKNKDDEQTINFMLRPLAGAAEGKAELRAVATVGGQQYSRGIQTIEYPHIPTQTLFPEAVAPLVKLQLVRRGQNVGYLMGAGDEVPDALRQIGYNVTLLKPEDISAARLKQFDAVLLGVRAYNTIDKLKTVQPELLKYIEGGGNVVVQYTVNYRVVIPQIGPYPMTLSNDRVTVEDAPVTFLKPQHPLLNSPNKLTEQDFKGWVQEQGLYYPSQWDAHYQPVISSHDPGEAAKESAILVTDYGKGHYIYTGLSLFRELPAGVPGAYRIITNMISYGKEPVQ
ncbi:PIG-L family deacetylase [Hymenobacter sp. BRD67]|uniref:PIG-L family deacetylase n=1 Tax=Hymenobacter sp. BRD67 TaxID=2675877 RepID=UPI001565758F|nr:PIG-L family deacetylase [Hymenobacter sp. BRD67]QKG51730.1 PIG-L family deacetylase [Hymenobacter sp. BRD67]